MNILSIKATKNEIKKWNIQICIEGTGVYHLYDLEGYKLDAIQNGVLNSFSTYLDKKQISELLK